MSGGYRYGAGRHGWKRVAELTPQFAIDYLDRRGCLLPGSWNTYSWRRGDEPAGNVMIAGGEDYIRVVYKFRDSGGDWLARSILIPIVRTVCNFGGGRPWFRCPHCAQRAGVVFVDQTVGCRRCMVVGYECQRENLVSRLNRGIDKLEERLGWNDIEKWSRRKGMHRRTYERLKNRLERLEQEEDWAAAMRWGAMCSAQR